MGTSRRHRITQRDVDHFAVTTGDRQWIHCDVQRAANGPFGTTVVHGYLTLSLLPVLLDEVIVVEGTQLTLNYGLDRVRFPAVLPVSAEFSASVDLLSAEEKGSDVQVVFRVTIAEGPDAKPCCVADSVLRYVRRHDAPDPV